MTTYIICDNCEDKFKSPIQVANLETAVIKDNWLDCPHCGKQTLAENRNMINEE